LLHHFTILLIQRLTQRLFSCGAKPAAIDARGLSKQWDNPNFLPTKGLAEISVTAAKNTAAMLRPIGRFSH